MDLSGQIPGYEPSHDFYFKSFDDKGAMIFGNPWGPTYRAITVTPDNIGFFSTVAVG